MTTMGTEQDSARVQLARTRVEEATRAARLAVIAATPQLRARALRRTRYLRIGLYAVAALVVVLLVATAVAAWQVRGHDREAELQPVSYTHLTLPTNREV